MKLTQENIQQLDKRLQVSGIKYLDVRVELIDHLVTEYEAMDNAQDWNLFVKNRLPWCKKVMKDKSKTTHWSYQRSLWKTFFEILKETRVLFGIIFFIGLMFFIRPWLTDGQYFMALILPMLTFLIWQIALMVKNGLGKEKRNSCISAKYLFNIFALPNLILYLLNLLLQLNRDLVLNQFFIIPYVIFGSLLGLAAIRLFRKKRDVVIAEYNKLVQYSL
ncbi:MAG: hypothetical protein KJO73_11685 [Croceitalea sp.]|nr:hypothetical protein [Croceitalea sp.]MBT8239278.1 hypothetical protein [Croceitalea sp.]